MLRSTEAKVLLKLHGQLATIALITLMLVVFAGPALAAQRTLEVWYYGADYFTNAVSIYEQEFEKAHPDIDVVMIANGSDIHEKAAVVLAGGSPPDIMQLQITDGMAQGMARAFTPLPPRLTETMGRAILDPLRELVTQEGRVYGVPNNVYIGSAPILTINKDEWAAAGLLTSFDSLDSWKEMLSAFKRLTTKDPNGTTTRAGVTGFTGYSEQLFYNFVLWYGGTMYAKDGLTPLFVGNEGSRALSTMNELYLAYQTPMDRWPSTSFKERSAASVWGEGPYLAKGVETAGSGFSVGHVLIPPMDQGTDRLWVSLGGWAWWVPNGKSSPDSWAWMEYMLSRDAARIWVVNTGEMPADRRLLTERVVTEDYAIRPYTYVMPLVVPLAFKGNVRNWSTYMRSNLNLGVKGSMPVLEALMKASSAH